MKKFAVLVSMLMMFFAFSLTASAEVSPSGTPETPQTEVVVQPQENVSPKTADAGVAYSAAFVLADAVLIAGAGFAAKKAKEA